MEFTLDALAEGPYLAGITGAQLYVSVDGDVVIDTAVGHAGKGRAMTTETILPWCCCSKLATVLAAARVFEDAGQPPDSRVADVVPEYGQAGKQDVTFGQLLSHAVPYRTWEEHPSWDDVTALQALPADEALARVCLEPLSAAPGTRAVYTSIASWQVLAAAIERLTARPWQDSVRRYVFAPLGLRRSWPVMTARDRADHAADMAGCYSANGGDPDGGDPVPIEWPVDTVFGQSAGAGAHGPASELALLADCLRRSGTGPCGPVVSPGMARELTRHRREGIDDPMFAGLDATWGWGFCTDPLVFGVRPRTRVAGHTGFNSSFVCADLDRGVTIAYISNAFYPDAVDRSRKWGITRAVYKDLGLVPARATAPASSGGARVPHA